MRVVVWVRLLVREESCDDKAAARRVELVDSSVRAVNMEIVGESRERCDFVNTWKLGQICNERLALGFTNLTNRLLVLT